MKAYLLMKSRSALFFLLLLGLLLMVPKVVKTYAQASESTEIIATIESPSIVQGSTIEELNFSTSYQLSRIFSNLGNGTYLYSLSKGALLWSVQGQPIGNVTIRDNLGNGFPPLVNDTTIMNPLVEVMVPSFFSYKVTLFFETEGDVNFDNQTKTYQYYVGVSQSPLPVSVSVRLSQEYTIVQSSNGCSIESEPQLTVLRWNGTQGQTIDCLVRFIPFKFEPTIRSMKITADFPMIHPESASIRATVEEIFDVPSRIMIWKVIPVFELPVPFPANATNVQVASVLDGKGECGILTKRPSNITDSSNKGRFFVDYENKMVLIYPRPSYEGEFDQFYVQVTFVCPNNSTDNTFPLEESFLPYRGSAGVIFKFTTPQGWNLNITGNFEVEFILPFGTEPVPSDGERIVFGMAGTRQTATYVYNSPVAVPLMPSDKWTIMFDVISLKNFFILQVCTSVALIVILIVLIVASRFLRTKTKLTKKILTKIFSTLSLAGLVGTNILTYFVLGGFSLRLLTHILLVVEVVLLGGIIVVIVRQYQAKDFQEKSPNMDEHGVVV